jgi:hypothetical protein
MIESQLVGRHISETAPLLGTPITIPDRPPEGDPDFGLSRYVEFPDRGFVLLIDWNDVVECVQFFGGEPGQDNQQYKAPLARGLQFSSSRTEVRSAMGTPVASRDGGYNVSPLKAYPWDWFACDGLKVHFEYDETCGRVRMVSAMKMPQQA